MNVLLDLKNFFKNSKSVKVAKKSITRSTAEEEQKIAKERGRATHVYGGCRDRNLQAIFIPRRSKLKGYQMENRRFKKVA